MKRVPTSEWLDTNSGTDAEISGSLADLCLINRWFGGIRTSEFLINRAAARTTESLSILEVACASGDVPRQIRRRFQKRGIEIDLTLLDRSFLHLGPDGTPAVAADALALPFRDNSFDIVSCGLFAHHLSPEQLRLFAVEALRVARRAVLINDLVRSRAHLALVYAGYLFYRSRLTRHDAPASVYQAYRPREIHEILRAVDARIEITRHYLCRMGIILWKSAPHV